MFIRYVAPIGYIYDLKENYNMPLPNKQISDSLLYTMGNISCHYNTNAVLHPLGEDSAFLDAQYSFSHYDEYIKNIRKNQNNYKYKNVTIQYTNPDEFFKILNEKQNKFVTYKRNDDFFPYRDTPRYYWTGFYTTQPQLKRLIMYAGR